MKSLVLKFSIYHRKIYIKRHQVYYWVRPYLWRTIARQCMHDQWLMPLNWDREISWGDKALIFSLLYCTSKLCHDLISLVFLSINYLCEPSKRDIMREWNFRGTLKTFFLVLSMWNFKGNISFFERMP